MIELIWEGKYYQAGRSVAPPRVVLAFQEASVGKDRRRRTDDQDRRSTCRTEKGSGYSCSQETIIGHVSLLRPGLCRGRGARDIDSAEE